MDKTGKGRQAGTEGTVKEGGEDGGLTLGSHLPLEQQSWK